MIDFPRWYQNVIAFSVSLVIHALLVWQLAWSMQWQIRLPDPDIVHAILITLPAAEEIVEEKTIEPEAFEEPEPQIADIPTPETPQGYQNKILTENTRILPAEEQVSPVEIANTPESKPAAKESILDEITSQEPEPPPESPIVEPEPEPEPEIVESKPQPEPKIDNQLENKQIAQARMDRLIRQMDAAQDRALAEIEREKEPTKTTKEQQINKKEQQAKRKKEKRREQKRRQAEAKKAKKDHLLKKKQARKLARLEKRRRQAEAKKAKKERLLEQKRARKLAKLEQKRRKAETKKAKEVKKRAERIKIKKEKQARKLAKQEQKRRQAEARKAEKKAREDADRQRRQKEKAIAEQQKQERKQKVQAAKIKKQEKKEIRQVLTAAKDHVDKILRQRQAQLRAQQKELKRAFKYKFGELDAEKRKLAKKLVALLRNARPGSGEDWLQARMEAEFSQELLELAQMKRKLQEFQDQIDKAQASRELVAKALKDKKGSFEENLKRSMRELNIADSYTPDFKDIYRRMIKQKMRRYWQRPNSEKNAGLRLKISLAPNGKISNPVILSSTGNARFDKSVLSAVEKTGGLAIPNNIRLYKKKESISFNFPGPG